MSAGVYLYCIGRREDLTDERVASLGLQPVDGSDASLRTLHEGDLSALVSDTEVREFDIQRDQLMAHHRVLESAMTLGDILPVSYGTVAASEQDIIEALLRETSEQLTANLEHIKGRIELSLRIMWDQDQLFEEIVDESDEIRELRDMIAGVPEEQSFSERIRLGQLTSQAIEMKREYERDQILQTLEPYAVDIHIKQGGGDQVVLNASFLVDRDQEPAFDEAVQEVGGPRQARMTFRYLGPLPPASFVSVFIPMEE